MAKIDITKIEGFDKMSAEDKVKALLGYELPEADHTGYVKKETFDKTATELASFKKKEREALSEAERKAAEQADKITEQEGKITQLTEEIEAFKTREQTATYAAQYVGLGYDAELAQATAAAIFMARNARSKSKKSTNPSRKRFSQWKTGNRSLKNFFLAARPTTRNSPTTAANTRSLPRNWKQNTPAGKNWGCWKKTSSDFLLKLTKSTSTIL